MIVTLLYLCWGSLYCDLIEILHQGRELPVLEPHLPRYGLPLEDTGPDLDKLVVTLHALVGPLLLGDVHPHCGPRRVNVGLYHCGKVLQDQLHGGR